MTHITQVNGSEPRTMYHHEPRAHNLARLVYKEAMYRSLGFHTDMAEVGRLMAAKGKKRIVYQLEACRCGGEVG